MQAFGTFTLLDRLSSFVMNNTSGDCECFFLGLILQGFFSNVAKLILCDIKQKACLLGFWGFFHIIGIYIGIYIEWSVCPVYM